MSKTIQTEKRKRGFFGWIFLMLFWIFNLLMIAWLFATLGAWGELDPTTSEAQEAGRGLGMVVGLGMIFGLWAIGMVVFGGLAFATRGKKVIETVHQD